MYYEFEAAGFDIDIANPKDGLPTMDLGPINYRRMTTNDFMETSEDWQDVGFPDNADIWRLAKEIHENSGMVATVCHGPAPLVNVTTIVQWRLPDYTLTSQYVYQY